MNCRALGIFLTLTTATAACGDDSSSPEPPIDVPLSPTAVARSAASSVTEGASLEIDGSNSIDPGGLELNFAWSQLSGPTVSFADAAAASTSFTAPEVTANTSVHLRLTVTNSRDKTATDDLFITIIDGGRSPRADAGMNQAVSARVVVTLDGTASTDSDGTVDHYLWEQSSGPQVTLSDASVPQPTFTAPDVTRLQALRFRLTVTDNDGLVDTASVRVDVSPKAATLAFVNLGAEKLRNTSFSPGAVEVQNASGQRIESGPEAIQPYSLSLKTGTGSLLGPLNGTTVGGRLSLEGVYYDRVEAGVEIELSTTTENVDGDTVTLDIVWPSEFPAVLASRRIYDTQLVGSKLLVVGSFQGSTDFDLTGAAPSVETSSGDDAFVALYSATDELIWLRVLGGSQAQVATAAIVGRHGDAVVTFELEGAVDFSTTATPLESDAAGGIDAAVARFDMETGETVWLASFGGSGDESITGLALLDNDDPIAVGTFDGTTDFAPGATVSASTADGVDAYVLRLDESNLSAGSGEALLNSAVIGGVGDDRAAAVVVSPLSEVVVVGSLIGADSAFVEVFGANLSSKWSHSFGGDAGASQASSVAIVGQSIAVGGTFGGTGDFDPGAATLAFTATAQDGFMSLFSLADGSLIYSRHFSGAGDESIEAVATSDELEARFIVGGNSDGPTSVDFGTGSMEIGMGMPGMFLAALDLAGRPQWTGAVESFDLHSLRATPSGTFTVVSEATTNGELDVDPFDPAVALSCVSGEFVLAIGDALRGELTVR